MGFLAGPCGAAIFSWIFAGIWRAAVFSGGSSARKWLARFSFASPWTPTCPGLDALIFSPPLKEYHQVAFEVKPGARAPAFGFGLALAGVFERIGLAAVAAARGCGWRACGLLCFFSQQLFG